MEPFISEIRLFSFAETPDGWLPCDGSTMPIAQFQALYSLLGTAYGGDGRSTFALPDLRGLLPAAAGIDDFPAGHRFALHPGEPGQPALVLQFCIAHTGPRCSDV